MATIRPQKIDGVKPMLMQYFPGNGPVSSEFLRAKVEEDTIIIAVKEGFIQFENGVYRITQKGKTYRNK